MSPQLARKRAPVSIPRDDDYQPDEPGGTITATRDESLASVSRRSRANGSNEPSRSHSASSKAKASTAKVEHGWSAISNKRGSTNRLDLKNDTHLIKLLDEEPFAVYGQHWITTKEGLRSYPCGFNQPYEKCPLCDIGTDIRYLAVINVIDMGTLGTGGKVTHENGAHLYLEMGAALSKHFSDYGENDITSPVSRDDLYFTVKRFKKDNGFYEFKVSAVKARDLVEDFNTEPLSDDELNEALASPFGPEVLRKVELAELKTVAQDFDDD